MQVTGITPENVQDLVAVASGTTNNEIFDDTMKQIFDKVSEGHEIDLERTMYDCFTVGMKEYRFTFGKLSRKWGKEEMKLVARLNTYSDRRVTMELLADQDVMFFPFIMFTAALGSIALADKTKRKRVNPPVTVLSLACEAFITDNVRFHVARQQPFHQRLTTMRDWEADLQTRMRTIDKTISDWPPETKDNNEVIKLLTTFKYLSLSLYTLYQQKVSG